ncbi:SMI1/KNR4 family protein [Pyxidicoccus caerfyrddinensis]|uniref:SMI1/KNR4 family protein n=1 Tax=Pyxidicoccus caerfyrddinensis TaxID=2709663 RepID=UPI0013DC3FB8|nr:SMI1/KNR4 family protein [Pyxidicoccus caerfyrddinensis]
MDWPLVIEFIRQRDPAFMSRVEGVPAAAVAALAAGRGVTLPASYVEFLRRMGSNSNGYAPFGPTQDHGLAAIAERLDDEDAAPSGRFFPVAIETDESLDPLYDYCLDLQRGDGDDAPLVMLEPGVDLEWQTPVEISETFGERITASVFNHFALRRLAGRDVVSVGGTLQAGEGRAALQRALVLLQRAGFAPVLSLSGRVACLQAGPLSVDARVNENYELLTLRLGGDDPRAVTTLAEQLLTDLPGARRPVGPRHLD